MSLTVLLFSTSNKTCLSMATMPSKPVAGNPLKLAPSVCALFLWPIVAKRLLFFLPHIYVYFGGHGGNDANCAADCSKISNDDPPLWWCVRQSALDHNSFPCRCIRYGVGEVNVTHTHTTYGTPCVCVLFLRCRAIRMDSDLLSVCVCLCTLMNAVFCSRREPSSGIWASSSSIAARQ